MLGFYQSLCHLYVKHYENSEDTHQLFQMYSYLVHLSEAVSIRYSYLLYSAWVYLIMVAVQSCFFPAPYGKFTTTSGISILTSLTKVRVPARLGWCLQEIPSFLVALSAVIHLFHQGELIKIVILGPYLVHYFNRAIVFPLQIKHGEINKRKPEF